VADHERNWWVCSGIYCRPLSLEGQKVVFDICARNLLTSFGLRCLGAGEAGFIGRYSSDCWQRDAAYHQGTVWGWLIGLLVNAYLRDYHNPQGAWRYLQPFFNHLSDHGLGSISEIFDGNTAFNPGGCVAQAWSVAKVLQVGREIQLFSGDVFERNKTRRLNQSKSG